MVKVFSGTGRISTSRTFDNVDVRTQSALGDDDLVKSVHVAMKADVLNAKLGAFDNAKDEHANPSINISMADMLNSGADALAAAGVSAVPTDLANAYSGFKSDIEGQLDAAAEQLFDEESMDDTTIDGAEVLRLMKAAPSDASTLNVNNLNQLFRRAQDRALSGRQPGSAGGVSAGFVAGDIIHIVDGMRLSMDITFAAEDVDTDANNKNLAKSNYTKVVNVDLALKIESSAAL